MKKSLVLALVVFALPLAARAESVVWNSQALPSLSYTYTFDDSYNGDSYDDDIGAYTQTLDNTMVQVRYAVSVSELDAQGTKVRPLSSGATIAKGSRVLYEFVPHQYTDITWNGTGGISDTPYGAWTANAGLPSSYPICSRDAATMYNEHFYHEVQGKRGSTKLLYALLAGAPPAKQIARSGVAAECSPWSDGISQVCTMTESGTHAATFQFEGTVGNFYPSVSHGGGHFLLFGANAYQCEVTGLRPMAASDSSAFSLPIPPQTIPVSITVTEPTGSAPALASLSSGGACVVGQSHTISFAATDPDGDQVRYRIDWNSDGSVDEYVPPSGYVPSGASQNTSRTYSTSGTKAVKVMAEDSAGHTSDWRSITFECSPAAEEEDVDGGQDDEGNNAQCSPPYICRGSDLYRRAGAQCADETFVQSCAHACSGGACLLPPEGEGDEGGITASPWLIRAADRSTVTWTTSGMLEDSCTVSENNPDINDSGRGPSGSFQSSPLLQKTIFTLSCTTLDDMPFTDSATVSILPRFQEN